ncbi:MAG: TonB-dependent receptor, partial [Myxococcota bacterium]
YELGTFSGWGANLTLAWQVLPDAEVAIKYNRGWKGGHFNGGAFDSFALVTPVRPEIVNSFELNGRSRWWDGRLILNGAFFLYDYQDLQVFQLEQTPRGFTIDQLINAKDARVYGVEVDLQAEPLDGLNIEFHWAWLHSYYLEFENELFFDYQVGGPQPPPVRIRFSHDFDYSGNPLIAAPQFALAGAVDYSIALPRTGNLDLGFLTPRVSFSWKDEIFFDACSGRGSMCNFPKGTFGEDALWLFNASMGWWSADERIQVTLWVLNLADEVYRIQSFDQTGGLGNILELYGDPRTYGITVGLYFY